MNKKQILLAITLVSFFTSNAQITKGNWMVGGSGNYNTFVSESTRNAQTTTSKGSYLSVYSKIGYFVADKFAVGLTPSFAFSNSEGSNNSSTAYGIGPFVRYYFLKSESIINLFSEASYHYGQGFIKHNRGTKSNGTIFKAGSAVYFNSSVALELSLDYSIQNANFYYGSEGSSKTFNVGIGFQIHLEKE